MERRQVCGRTSGRWRHVCSRAHGCGRVDCLQELTRLDHALDLLVLGRERLQLECLFLEHRALFAILLHQQLDPVVEIHTEAAADDVAVDVAAAGSERLIVVILLERLQSGSNSMIASARVLLELNELNLARSSERILTISSNGSPEMGSERERVCWTQYKPFSPLAQTPGKELLLSRR